MAGILTNLGTALGEELLGRLFGKLDERSRRKMLEAAQQDYISKYPDIQQFNATNLQNTRAMMNPNFDPSQLQPAQPPYYEPQTLDAFSQYGTGLKGILPEFGGLPTNINDLMIDTGKKQSNIIEEFGLQGAKNYDPVTGQKILDMLGAGSTDLLGAGVNQQDFLKARGLRSEAGVAGQENVVRLSDQLQRERMDKADAQRRAFRTDFPPVGAGGKEGKPAKYNEVYKQVLTEMPTTVNRRTGNVEIVGSGKQIAARIAKDALKIQQLEKVDIQTALDRSKEANADIIGDYMESLNIPTGQNTNAITQMAQERKKAKGGFLSGLFKSEAEEPQLPEQELPQAQNTEPVILPAAKRQEVIKQLEKDRAGGKISKEQVIKDLLADGIDPKQFRNTLDRLWGK